MAISFIGIIVVIIVIAIIILATRSKGTLPSGSGTEGMTTARHIWLYLITIIALGIFAAGVGQLLALLFDVTIKGSYMIQVGGRNFKSTTIESRTGDDGDWWTLVVFLLERDSTAC